MALLRGASAASRYSSRLARSSGARHISILDGEVELLHRTGPRAQRIMLIRHGESLGNVDESTYATTADWRIPLSDAGREQALDAGQRLCRLLDGEKVFAYYSPYLRASETCRHVLSQLPSSCVIGVREEPRIAEQQFGNFQNPEQVLASKEERNRFGRFFYRFPNGEAGLDVYSRVTSFISTMFRDLAQLDAHGHDMSESNLLIVTHGLTLRLFLMRCSGSASLPIHTAPTVWPHLPRFCWWMHGFLWLIEQLAGGAPRALRRYFHLSVEEFEATNNPANAFIAVMECRTSPCGRQQWCDTSTRLPNGPHVVVPPPRPPPRLLVASVCGCSAWWLSDDDRRFSFWCLCTRVRRYELTEPTRKHLAISASPRESADDGHHTCANTHAASPADPPERLRPFVVCKPDGGVAH